ncbi:hypothetical protein X777_05468 [Ooceraea biroi]|uniref:Uncharacterized protein n=1 Tax=Ooceraea biroi TaxID=2015173 RepID=A0A026WIL6_OOCBI|nr:hypothetical protein X777_05468 [Ooceraea biroi]
MEFEMEQTENDTRVSFRNKCESVNNLELHMQEMKHDVQVTLDDQRKAMLSAAISDFVKCVCNKCQFQYISSCPYIGTTYEINSVVSKHRIINNHDFDWLNVDILHQESHRRKREIAEMFFIKRHRHSINLMKDTENLPGIYDSVLFST